MNFKLLKPCVLFLDIDGVLVTADGDTPQNKCVNALQRIIDNVNPSIVISSSWRLDPEFDANKLLSDFGLKNFNVIGQTGQQCETRGEEIKLWLSDNSTDQFVIIDDDDSGMSDLFHHWFQTTWEHGLTEDIANRVISYILFDGGFAL